MVFNALFMWNFTERTYRMMSQKQCALLFGTISLFAFYVSAQTISGKVTDALSKSPVVGVKVTLVEVKKECSTDSIGVFKFDSLDKGNYSVRFEAEKYLR
jgi:Carboxypeptidase regulatory-like domain